MGQLNFESGVRDFSNGFESLKCLRRCATRPEWVLHSGLEIPLIGLYQT
jgi:hypothetical protein